jgi:cytochrome c-type biogenesis protein CcmH/NrfG
MTGKIHLKDEYRMYDSAVVILEEGLKFFPDDAEMHFLLGKAYFHKKNPRGMGEQFALAESLQGNKEAKWKEELNEMKLETWMQTYNQGVSAYKEQDFDAALKNFETCTVINPSDARAFWLCGDTYRVKGQYEQAIAALETGLKLAPDDAQILRSYADVLFYVGRGEEALEKYGEVLEKDPKNVDVLFNVATIHYSAGDYDHAISRFQELVAADPAYKDAHFNMGSAYLLKIGQMDKALDSLKDESGEYLKDEKSTAKIQELTQKRDDFVVSSQAAFEKVLELDSTDMEAQGHLAQLYLKQEKYDQAVIMLETMVEKDSTNCKAWQQLAFIYAKKNIGEKANQAYKKAQDCMGGGK